MVLYGWSSRLCAQLCALQLFAHFCVTTLMAAGLTVVSRSLCEWQCWYRYSLEVVIEQLRYATSPGGGMFVGTNFGEFKFCVLDFDCKNCENWYLAKFPIIHVHVWYASVFVYLCIVVCVCIYHEHMCGGMFVLWTVHDC